MLYRETVFFWKKRIRRESAVARYLATVIRSLYIIICAYYTVMDVGVTLWLWEYNKYVIRLDEALFLEMSEKLISCIVA